MGEIVQFPLITTFCWIGRDFEIPSPASNDILILLKLSLTHLFADIAQCRPRLAGVWSVLVGGSCSPFSDVAGTAG